MKHRQLVLMDSGMFCQGMHVKTGIYYLYKGSYVLLCKDVILTDELIYKLQNAAKGTSGVYIEEENYKEVWEESLRQYSADSCIYQNDYKRARQAYNDVLSKTVSFLGGLSLKKGIALDTAETITDAIAYDLNNQSQSLMLQCINTIYHTDNYLYTHCINVSTLNGMIGKWMQLPETDIKNLIQAGLMHDLGKLKIPAHILNKPGRLTASEFAEIQRHPLYSYDILLQSGEKAPGVLLAARHHHERPDGSGYPDGLSHPDISLFARITAVSDVYDAMVSKRCYKEAVTPFEILAQFKEKLFSNLDYDIVNIFLENIAYLLVGMRIQLSNGETGEVVFVKPSDYAHPIVKVGSRIFTTDPSCQCIHAERAF